MRQNFIYIITTLAILLLDQFSKLLAISNLSVHKNYGIFLGLFSGTTTYFRVISLSTISIFIFFLFLVLLYVLPKTLILLKVSLSMINISIFSNSCDRIFRGFTVDFIPISFSHSKYVFNIADIFLFIGVALFIYSIFKFENKIWFPGNNRSKFVINSSTQLFMAFKFSLASFFTSLLLGIYSYTFLKSLSYFTSKQISSFMILFSITAILFTLCIFVIGLYITHKSAGPLYAFENYVESLLKGNREEFQLRTGDQHKELELVAKKLKEFIEKH